MNTRAVLPPLFVALLWAPAAAPATIHVPSDQPTIQAGIDAAAPSDTVLVAPGIYMGGGNRDIEFGGKDVVLASAAGPEATVIDCQGSLADPHRSFSFNGAETRAAVVAGFTIRNGNVEGSGEDGGAISCRSPITIVDCHFNDNRARAGGAISCVETAPSISHCSFTGNTAALGGALEFDGGQPIITHTTFSANAASSAGGAIRALGGPPDAIITLEDCVFEANSTDSSGGAINSQYTHLHLTRCHFSQNDAVYQGGAVYCGSQTSATVTQCTFIENSAGTTGGGLHVEDASYTVDNCTFAQNTADRGGGLSGDDSSPTLRGCTFSGNSATLGGGMHFQVPIHFVLLNTIVAFSSAGEAVACNHPPVILTMGCCDFYGNAGGDWVGCVGDQYGINGNISEDPLFCDADAFDYTLDAASPCAPTNSGDCGLIGAMPVACGTTALEPTTWGSIKAAFR